MKHIDRMLCMLCALALLLTACAPEAPDPAASPASTLAERVAPTIAPLPDASAPEGGGGTVLDYSADGLYVTVTLPEGWAGCFDEGDGSFPCAKVWIEEAPEQTMRFWCARQPVGLCGTGVTFGELALEDGRTVMTAQERIEDSLWFCWILEAGELQFFLDGSLAPECFEVIQSDLAALLQSASAEPDD